MSRESERRLELDPALIERAIAGDRPAFQELTERSWGLVFVFVQQRVSDRELARDLTQEAFLQAYSRRATLREGTSFVAWLLTIASNKIVDYHRRRSVRPEVHLGEEETHTVATSTRGPTHSAQLREEQDALRSALADLDDLYRTVLILRYWSDLKPGQIARLLGEPEGTIRNRIFRAHLRLRRALESRARARHTSPGESGAPTDTAEAKERAAGQTNLTGGRHLAGSYATHSQPEGTSRRREKDEAEGRERD